MQVCSRAVSRLISGWSGTAAAQSIPMKTTLLRRLLFTGAWCALATSSLSAQIVEFTATINAAQETPASTSPATGSALLVYDLAANTFELTVTIFNLANPITASHVHEGAAGLAGPVVTGLGAEAVYVRDGNTVRGTFSGVAHGGTPLTLLQNGAYLNFHSAAFPGGEVRGQLIARPKRLTAVLRGDQEVPATTSTAYGAALITYNPGTNKISTRLNIYNFTHTLTASHYHEAAVGASGGVVHNLGGAAVYAQNGTFYGAVFSEQTYSGDPIKLLQGGAYLNVHSNVNPPGEIRGQVWVSDELDVPRLINLSSRGWVGTGDAVMISGFTIEGDEPVRVLITAKGPSLTGAGVDGALANPHLSLHDSAGRALVTNDDFATAFSIADMPSTNFAVTVAEESALLLVLPPGGYTSVVSGVGGTTGVAITEVYEVRAPLSGSVIVRDERRRRRSLVPDARVPAQIAAAKAPIEFCVATPLALAAVTR